MSDYIARLRSQFKALILKARDRSETVEAYVMDDLVPSKAVWEGGHEMDVRPLSTFRAEWGEERRTGRPDRRKQTGETR